MARCRCHEHPPLATIFTRYGGFQNLRGFVSKRDDRSNDPFLVLAVILVALIWYSEHQHRVDNADKPEINIMQTRQELRLVSYLLGYIGVVLALMVALLVYKLH
jgi:hypothetical protein